MPEPTDPPARSVPDALEPAGPVPCRCGSLDHPATRIGDQISPSGSAIRAVYVCPAISAAGLDGAL